MGSLRLSRGYSSELVSKNLETKKKETLFLTQSSLSSIHCEFNCPLA